MQSTLEDEIFGGELSDLSEDEQPAQQRQPGREEDAVSTEEEEAGSGDDYADRQLPAKFNKVKRAREEGDDAGRAKSLMRIPRKKRARAAADEPAEEAPLDPEEAKRRALEERLDAILKKPKPKKKRRATGEEDLGDQDEESMIKLRRDMTEAFQLDASEIAHGRPAIHKLKMLPEVVEMMQKNHLELVALDSGILGAMKEWLKPAQDKSLPSLAVQRDLFAILTGLSSQIDTSTLKESEIGPVVLFYSKCARVDPAIKRTADRLITAWLRPLMKRSATWRDRPIELAAESASPVRRAGTTITVKSEDDGQSMVRNMAAEARRANIPQALQTQFTVAPRSNTKGSGFADKSHGVASLERFKSFSSKLKSSRKKVR